MFTDFRCRRYLHISLYPIKAELYLERTGTGKPNSFKAATIVVYNFGTHLFRIGFSKTSSAWTSTPDLGGDKDNDSANAVSFSLKLPKRRATGPLPLDTGQIKGKSISNKFA